MKKYTLIYADPPWSFREKTANGSAVDATRGTK